MNQYLLKFIRNNHLPLGKALDLGAGEMFDIAYLKHLGWEADGVDLRTGVDLNNEHISPNGPYDLVFSCFVWQKLSNNGEILKTAFNNLKNGGRVFFLTFDKTDNNSRSKFDAENCMTAFEQAGFVAIKTDLHDFYDNDDGHKHWHKILEISGVKGNA